MIEDRLAEQFRTAVAGEPPLGFDPDDVVTEAGRRRKRRQAMTATALATGGVALAAVAVFATSSISGPSGVTAGANPTGTSVAETPPGKDKTESNQPVDKPKSFPGSDVAVANLEQVIPQVLRERVTGLSFDKPDAGTLMVSDNPRGIGGAYLVAGTTHRYVTIEVYHDPSVADPLANGDYGVLVSDTPQQDGSHLRVYSYESDGAQAMSVVQFRTDGVVVEASTTAKEEPGQTGLAVNQEVLTTIATDQRLTF